MIIGSVARILQVLGLLGSLLEILSKLFRAKQLVIEETISGEGDDSSRADKILPETHLLDVPRTLSDQNRIGGVE